MFKSHVNVTRNKFKNRNNDVLISLTGCSWGQSYKPTRPYVNAAAMLFPQLAPTMWTNLLNLKLIFTDNHWLSRYVRHRPPAQRNENFAIAGSQRNASKTISGGVTRTWLYPCIGILQNLPLGRHIRLMITKFKPELQQQFQLTSNLGDAVLRNIVKTIYTKTLALSVVTNQTRYQKYHHRK